MIVIQEILTLLHGKNLRFYTDQTHGLYTLKPWIKTCTVSYSISAAAQYMYVYTQTCGYYKVYWS